LHVAPVKILNTVMEQTNTTTPLIASSLTELQFNTLVAHSHDCIALLNAHGLFSYVSPSVERISGYAPAELLGNVKDDFIHPADAPEYARQIEQLKAAPGKPYSLPTVLNTKTDNGTGLKQLPQTALM
jgi:PAS domain S-box-containing protein